MAKGSQIIKDLDNQLRNKGRITDINEASGDIEAKVNSGKDEPLVGEVKDDKEADVNQTTSTDIKAKSSVTRNGKKEEEKLSAEQINDVESFIKLVKEWDRDKGGQKNMIRLDDNLNVFLGVIKNTTGLPAVQFVNYILNDFLMKNQKFVHSIYKKTRETPFIKQYTE